MATHSARNRLAEPRFGSVGAGSIPRGMVAALPQDRAGFLWPATGDGLVRYDGDHFRPQERVTAKILRYATWAGSERCVAARDGRLWIGTEWDDLAIVDPAAVQGQMLEQCGSSATENPGPVSGLVESSAVSAPTVQRLLA